MSEWLELSPVQRYWWALDRDSKTPSRTCRALEIVMTGDVDYERFRTAWLSTIRAHDVFGLLVDADEPRQRFVDVEPIIEELTVNGPFDRTESLEKIMGIGFEVGSAPWGLALIASEQGTVQAILRIHCLVCDMRSLDLIAREVSDRYLYRPVEPAPSFKGVLAARNFADQKKMAEADSLLLEERVARQPPAMAMLACDRDTGTSGITRRSLKLSRELCQAFIERAGKLTKGSLAEAEKLLVLAAAVAWLYRLGERSDITVCAEMPLPDPGIERVIGPLDGLSFCRIGVEEGDTFVSLIDKVGAAWRFSMDHWKAVPEAHTSADAFIESLSKSSRECNGNGSISTISGSATAFWSDATNVKTPFGIHLCFFIEESSGEISIDIDEGKFPPSERDRPLRYLVEILGALLREPTSVIADVDIMLPGEAEQLSQLGRGRESPIAPDFLETIEWNVRERPEAIAIEFGDQRMRYSELGAVTDRIALELRSMGVMPGARVAVALPRGFGEVCSFLAVLKAGGAYVPVDPLHPVDRVRVVLEDAEPQALIAPPGSPLRAALPPGVPTLDLDDPRDLPMQENRQGPDSHPDPSQLAYILFTSGSTGRPKGVEIPRGALSNFLQSMAHEPGLSSTDRVLAITTTTFDIAGLELFLPLYVGATIVLADRETAADPSRLRRLAEHADVTLMQATPATWRLLLDAGWTGNGRLKMLCGGESMSMTLAKRLLPCGSELWNVYGPTETTVWSTIQFISRDVDRITIGHPIDRTSVSIRDGKGRLSLRGCIGEICIGGAGLALGYRGRPELTAERFPTDATDGTRYYRTGDLGRYVPDGRLECLGRLDHQIKVRGFRIEPADIEAQLRTTEGVSEVLVLALQRGEGDPLLAAYWTGDATREAVYGCAKAKLPRYMLPAAYVHLDAFPMTTSGKIDRRQLPPPESRIEEGGVGPAPRNDRETVIAAIWREVLGLPFVPVDKDFFSMGGTSIRAVLMRSMLKEALGVELPLKTLFEHPTIEGIASQLEQQAVDDAPIVLALAKADGRLPWFGLLGVQLYEDIAKYLDGRDPVLAVHVPVRYIPGTEAIPSIPELARRYVEVIKRYQPHGPYYLFGLCHGGLVAFEAAVQLEEEGEEVALVVLLDAELPCARHTDALIRLGCLVRSLVFEPGRTLGRTGRKVMDSVLRGREKEYGKNGTDGAAITGMIPVDMPFDGPEIEAELERYQSLKRKAKCDVLTFRATERDAVKPWLRISADLGWSGRAGRLECHDIASSHLEIVRSSNGKEVAGIMAAARRSVEERRYRIS